MKKLTGFNSQTQEITIQNVSVSGQIPIWLKGTVFRNGPAQFEVGPNPGQSYKHWFDGLAMLVRFTFEDDGSVTFGNRFLRSDAYTDETSSERIRYRGFATDPCGGIFKRICQGWYNKFSDNANVSIAKQGDHFIAQSEPTMQIEFDEDLNTIGRVNYPDNISPQLTTAHPHHEAESGRHYNLLTKMGFHSYHIFSYQETQTEDPFRRVPIVSDQVSRPRYHHSFAMTEQYLVRTDMPFTASALKVLFSGKPFIENYIWEPDKPTTFVVFNKQDGTKFKEWTTDSFFTFHHVNSYEDPSHNRLVVDIVAYKDPSIISCFYLENIRNKDAHLEFPETEFRRYFLPYGSEVATYEVLSNNIELPRINYERCNAHDYQFAYAVGVDKTNIFDRLVKVDLSARTSQVWKESGCFPGEPIFVANPNAGAEDEGVILSVVLDGNKRTTFLLVLDAQSFTPIARIELADFMLPFGLHGEFIAS